MTAYAEPAVEGRWRVGFLRTVWWASRRFSLLGLARLTSYRGLGTDGEERRGVAHNPRDGDRHA